MKRYTISGWIVSSVLGSAFVGFCWGYFTDSIIGGIIFGSIAFGFTQLRLWLSNRSMSSEEVDS